MSLSCEEAVQFIRSFGAVLSLTVVTVSEKSVRCDSSSSVTLGGDELRCERGCFAVIYTVAQKSKPL